jgi:hypothetical protein
MHSWTIATASQGESVPWILAICTTCGVIRSQVAPGPQHERHVDLRGTCPGRPQEPASGPEEKHVSDAPGLAFG